MTPPKVLVVDDEESIRHVLGRLLQMKGCELRQAGSAEEALRQVEGWEPEVAILDIVLPGRNGIQLLQDIKQRYFDVEVLMMTSNASAETALQAMRQDAYDYLQKPFSNLGEVWTAVQRALEKRRLALKNRDLQMKQDELNRELSSSLSLDASAGAAPEAQPYAEILEYFIEMVAADLEVERISLMLFNPATGKLEVVASRGLPELDWSQLDVRLGDAVSGRVALSGEPVLVTDVLNDARSELFRYPHLSGSFLSVPILLKEAVQPEPQVLGVVNVTNRRSGRPFGPADLQHLSGLGRQLAVAIDEARQSNQLRKAYESLKAAQAQLVFSERLKAVGQMAAGVAHDFNNVLGVVLTRAELVLKQMDLPRPDARRIRSDVEAIKKTALQGAEVIKRVQDYTRIRKDVPKSPVDLGTVVRDAVEIARPKWKEECEARGVHVEVVLDLGGVPEVSGNLYELTQVVTNLIFNAVEAMPSGGVLTLRTRFEDETVMLAVSDTGVGMDEETQRRLFEPFFSTKEHGQGLGTSILFGIVARHGGEITVESRRGHGSTFRIALPRASDGADAVSYDAADPRAEFVAGRILLIDDDPMVRETYEEALAAGGHEVVALPGGAQAVARCRDESFDLVITDLSMEGMSGLEVAAAVKRLHPDLRVILFSGWTVQEQDANVREAGVDRVLNKPCMIEDLLLAVQQNLPDRAPA